MLSPEHKLGYCEGSLEMIQYYLKDLEFMLPNCAALHLAKETVKRTLTLLRDEDDNAR